jgi:hypothetical protein
MLISNGKIVLKGSVIKSLIVNYITKSFKSHLYFFRFATQIVT